MTDEQDTQFVLLPEDITADKANVNYLVLLQMNRINSMLATKIDTHGKNSTATANGVFFGLMSLEVMMSNILPEEYYKASETIKTKLITPTAYDKSIALSGKINLDELPKHLETHRFISDEAPFYALQYLSQWYVLLAKELPKIGLVSSKQKKSFKV